SSFGAAACIALLVSTFARARLSPTWRTVCTVFLTLGILDALLSLAILAVMAREDPSDDFWLLIPLTLGISLALAAFKQIRLLSSGGDGAVLRR
ncbi:hypothetical protein, partial [Deinococcus sp.]|uniref:hypothetical protein n=1 Tax=Deinococcus sp. TaxID=47478 RepID=UPI0025E0630D